MSGYTAPTIVLPTIGSGLGDYGYITDSYGQKTGVNQTAYDAAMQGQKDIAKGLNVPATGSTLGVPNDLLGTSGGVLGTGVSTGDLIGLGQLYMGYQGMEEQKRMNDKTIEATDVNIANAKTEAAATDAYRKAYGA